MKIEMRKLSEIYPYEKNARKIPQSAIDAVALSLKTYGWQQPLVIDKKSVIVVGHARRLGALQLEWTEAPVTIFEGTPAQARQYRLMDNRSHEESTWEPDLLRLELLDMKALDLDLAGTGFNSRELDAFLRPAVENEDDAPPLPEVAVTQPGDLWTMGEHRLLCGDATNTDDVARVMDGKQWNLMATDPPYLVNYTGGRHPQSWSNSKEVKDKHWDSYVDPDAAIGFYQSFLAVALPHAAEGCAVYQWHAALMQYLVHQAWLKCGLLVHQHIVWFKARPVLTHSHYMWQHEVAFYGWPKGKKPQHRPPANVKTVWQIDQIGESDGFHPTQKPVELARRPLEYHTEQNGVSFEPFSGSGTAIIAAERLQRRCFAIEISPGFVDVAVKRWMNLTGKQAYNQDGVCFPADKVLTA